ncbi:MAG: glycosyltransferase [Planctomycetota bacterium]
MRLLQAAGWEVALLGCEDSRNVVHAGPTFLVPAPPVTSPGAGGPWQKLRAFAAIVHNRSARAVMERAIDEFRPDVVHCHSIYHHLSPSVLAPLRERRIPAVMTLHDFKLLCPAIYLLDGQQRPCMRCRGRAPWHAIAGRCFKGSYLASLAVAFEAGLAGLRRVYWRSINPFVSPSRFLQSALNSAGLLSRRVRYLPYVLSAEDFAPRPSPPEQDGSALFAGRLSVEKGIWPLVRAFASPRLRRFQLEIAGSGPLESLLRRFVENERLVNVHFLGRLHGAAMRQARFRSAIAVVPSMSFDNSPMAVYESLAAGRAVVGSEIGGIPELILSGETGVLVPPGDEQALVEVIHRLLSAPREAYRLGREAWEYARDRFSGATHLEQLAAIYDEAMAC